MRRLKILVWHIHGSYLQALVHDAHDWYLPVKPGRPEGYLGWLRTAELPSWVHEVPAGEVRGLDLDLVIFQSPRNYLQDVQEILSPQQRERVARIYLEHNVPRPHAVDTEHQVDDPGTLLVHVTHFNRLMWNNNCTPSTVIEHSVDVDPSIAYSGDLARGITLINGIGKRPRIAGLDIFLAARKQIPLDIAGMETEAIGGLGDIKYAGLHRMAARYRFLFSPIRYTSLPLAVIEGMTIGMPIVALATTELPSVIENGVSGYVSCDLDQLIDRMRFLLSHPEEARRMGANARQVARKRFALHRFHRDWNRAFEEAIRLQPSAIGRQPTGVRDLAASMAGAGIGGDEQERMS